MTVAEFWILLLTKLFHCIFTIASIKNSYIFRGYMISLQLKQSMQGSSWIRKMFEAGNQLKEIHGADNVYDFSLGNPDVKPPLKLYSTLQKIIQQPEDAAHGYMPNAGYTETKAAMAKKILQDHTIAIDPNNIIMTCGAAGGLNIVCKTLLNPGDEIIVPKPFFAEYNFYITNHTGVMVAVDSNPDFSLNIDNIKNAITNKTKAILINSPNNPSGKIYTEQEITNLCDLLTEKKENGQLIYLLADEPYRELVYDNATVPSILQHYTESMIIHSFSKTLSIPGERIGFVAVNNAAEYKDDIIAGLTLSNRILGFVNAPALMQHIVAELYNESVNIDIYKNRRDLFMQGLTEAGFDFIKPEGAFYIFCKAPGGDDIAFIQHLQQYNILAVPGTGFGAPGYFRIAYCVSEKIIKKALPKFKQALIDFNK